MRNRVVILTENIKALRSFVERDKDAHQIVAIAVEPERTTHKLTPSEAERIYRSYSKGMTAAKAAELHGVSSQTVTRIALNPAHYGVDADPIRRTVRGTN